MKNRTEIIQSIIDKNNYTSYLEVGLGNMANFKAIKCQNKYGVDPELTTLEAAKNANLNPCTSDDFFAENKDKFDCVFLDGLHESEQVEKDLINIWNELAPNGTILIHDIKPLDEKTQRVPREQTQWTGDVWRAWFGLKKAYPKLKLSYIDERVGLGVIEKSRHKIESGFVDNETSYSEYNEVKGWEVK